MDLEKLLEQCDKQVRHCWNQWILYHDSAALNIYLKFRSEALS